MPQNYTIQNYTSRFSLYRFSLISLEKSPKQEIKALILSVKKGQKESKNGQKNYIENVASQSNVQKTGRRIKNFKPEQGVSQDELINTMEWMTLI